MDMQNVTSTSFDMVHYSMVDSNFIPDIYYGFNRPCLTGFRYLVAKSAFPDKYISVPLQIASTLWTIPALSTYEILYNVATIAATSPLALSATDTVFVHSLVDIRLVSMQGTLNNSF